MFSRVRTPRNRANVLWLQATSRLRPPSRLPSRLPYLGLYRQRAPRGPVAPMRCSPQESGGGGGGGLPVCLCVRMCVWVEGATWVCGVLVAVVVRRIWAPPRLAYPYAAAAESAM